MKLGPEALSTFLGERHSIRRFTDQPVSEESVRRVLAAACQAPSAHNRQPWRFAVVRSEEARRRLAGEMAACLRLDLEADGHSPEAIEARLDRRKKRVEQAPVVVLLCLSLADVDAYPDDRRQAAEHTMAVQSLALAGGYLLLATQAEGLGACWIGSPLFAPQAARQSLDLPSNWEPQGAILLGHPAEEGEATPRRPVDEVTLWR